MLNTQEQLLTDTFCDNINAKRRQYIYDELQKSKALLNDPNVPLTPHEDVIKLLKTKREATVNV